MSYKKIIFCFLFFVLLSNNSYAEEELAPGFDACMERAEGITSKSIDCYDAATYYWDIELNKNYKKVLKACDATDKDFAKICRDEFKKAELAWIKYRDTMSSALGIGTGTAAKVQAKAFFAYATKEQAIQLSNIELYW